MVRGVRIHGVRQKAEGTVFLRGRRSRCDLIAMYTYQTGGNREDGVRLVLEVQSGKKAGSEAGE